MYNYSSKTVVLHVTEIVFFFLFVGSWTGNALRAAVLSLFGAIEADAAE